MKLLAFLGSPRKHGNSEHLMEAFLQGARQAGGEPEIIRLCDLIIRPCQECGGCDQTGKCILEDDMIGLYERIVAVQRIVLASPIFFYGLTAQTKAFIDRGQALWSWQRLMGEHRWQPGPDRLGFFLSVAATRGAKVFDGAVLTMKYGYDAMGFRYAGGFLVRGVDRLGEMAGLPEKLKEAEEAGRKFMS